MNTETGKGAAEARYTALSTDRQPYLRRAEDVSKLTIPSLIPPDGHSPNADLYQPFQSVGAEGIKNLASKLALATLPPTAPFFRLSVDDFVIERIKAEGGPEAATEIQTGLSRYERAVMDDIETKADRNTLYETNLHLLASGNALLHDDDEEGLQLFHLRSFVCQRDRKGNPLEIITKEEISPDVLPEEVREVIEAENKQVGKDASADVAVYTWLKRVPRKWTVHQEVMAQVIPSSRGTYPLDAFPWYPLRLIKISGESYGRSYIGDHYGDLKSLEGLTKAIVEGSAAAARVLFGRKPNATTKAKSLSEAPNGAIITGDLEADVTVLQMEKYNDFRVALETAAGVEQRLQRAFLLTGAIQRDAERVTAEEIRLMAQELENSLGGVYSLLSTEFQLPYVRVKMRRAGRKKDWPKLPKGIVRPKIIAGLDALSRGHDRNKLAQYLATFAQLVGPEQAQVYLNPTEVAKRLAQMDGIDIDGLIRTEEEVQQSQQAGQMQQMVEKLGPAGIQAIQKQMQSQQPA